MWCWRHRICGGGGAGYVVCKLKIRPNQSNLVELGLGLSLAIRFLYSMLTALYPHVGDFRLFYLMDFILATNIFSGSF